MAKKPNRNGHRSPGGDKTFSSLADLTPDPQNARRHNPRNVGMLVDALHQVGAARSIVVDENGVVLAGNATIEAAAEAGIHKVKTVEADGSEIVAVVRRGLSKEQKTKLALYDNRVAELAEWNPDILSELVDTKELEGMFSDKELAEILTQTGIEPKDAEPQIDKAAELQQKWGTETGQLWVIGNHRLLVGDATNKADVGRLCANVTPSLMVTDPPYGVDYDPTWRDDKGAFGIGKVTMRGKVENDDNASWREAYELSPTDVAYIWHASRHCVTVNQNLNDAGYEIRAQIIWRKQHFAMSRGDYHWQHEPLFYAVRKGKKSGWLGDRTQSTIWDINNANPSGHTDSQETKLGHGTQKPLECMARPIRNHSGDVYDPFVGSGTTLVAAENLNRKCYAIEISPPYVAVCLERMTTAFPHLKIEKVDQARAA